MLTLNCGSIWKSCLDQAEASPCLFTMGSSPKLELTGELVGVTKLNSNYVIQLGLIGIALQST